MNKYVGVIAIAAICLVVGAGINAAYTQWQQTGTWTIAANTNFSLWTAIAGGTEIPSPDTLNLGTPPPDPSIINYYVQNDGNVPIRVTAAVIFGSGSATVTWNPSSGYVDIPVGSTRTQIILTLTGFSVGSGSLTVTFTSAQAP